MKTCRSCNGNNLSRIMSYGNMPLANSLLDTRNPVDEKFYPLELYFCDECALVQIGETVDPKLLFQDYAYFSSCSDTILKKAKRLVDKVVEVYNSETVVEIASNDGYLLQYYPDSVQAVGVDPAENIAKIANEKGILTIPEFFSFEFAKDMKRNFLKVDVIHAHNVLAHVADLNDFVAGVEYLLDKDGVFIIEVPYVKNMIEETLFDTVYHEHLCYFSLTALTNLLRNHNMMIDHYETLQVHGGSLRVYAKKPWLFDEYPDEEEEAGMGELSYYCDFQDRVNIIESNLRSVMSALRPASIAGVGASAKGNVLLNYCDIEVDYIGDNIPRKQGLFTPGKHIPIVSMDEMMKRNPDYILILAWNHAEEIMKKLSGFDGHFIVPIPEVKII